MKELFLKRMKEYLKEEYSSYEASLNQDAYRGLRINTTKITVNEFQQLGVCQCAPSAICPQSFQIIQEVQGLGNHPAHASGLFYIQEPSASSAVEVLNVRQGDWVLDLCAAPGGKSTQIAAKLAGTGCLVSNEIEYKRAQILLSNMERLGFSECMITSGHPQNLCEEMRGCFDKVLVDAPCSGEGMFKKHSKAMDDWSLEHVLACAKRQFHILQSAYQALKEDGILVYSTCTYAMEENEMVIYDFLKSHEDMELIDAEVSFGRDGLPYQDLNTQYVRRIFPMDQGEGHFVAKLHKRSSSDTAKLREVKNTVLPVFVETFLMSQIGYIPSYHIQIQDKLYVKNSPFITLKKSRILRQGTLCGEIIKSRIEPHQHFYTSTLYQSAFKLTYDMNDTECRSYLKGNLLAVSGYKGYTLLTWKGHPIAFAKGDGTVLKNKYPKGMRIKGNILY